MEGSFRALDGITLYEQWWHPSVEPKAVVGSIHGLCEHSGRFRETADYLTEQGFALESFDLRGHGRSGGEALQIDSFFEYLDDLDVFIGRVRDRIPDKPLFLMGQCMGASILLQYAAAGRTAVRGLIIIAPFIQAGPGLSPLSQKLAALCGRILPRMPLFKINPRHYSGDTEVLSQRAEDRLIYQGRVSAKMLYELLQTERRIAARIEHIACPLLILHGEDDGLAAVEASRILHSRVGSPDKMLKVLPGFKHDILHGPESETVRQSIAEWMAAHVRSDR